MLSDNVSFLRNKIQRLDDALPSSVLPSASPAQSFLNAFNSAKEELNQNSPVDQAVAINATLSGTRNLTASDASGARNGGFLSDAEHIEKHIASLIEEKQHDYGNINQSSQRDQIAKTSPDYSADGSDQSDLFAQTMVELLESLQSTDYRPQYTAGSGFEELLGLKQNNSSSSLLQAISLGASHRDSTTSALNKNDDQRADIESVLGAERLSELTEHEMAISQFYSNDTGVQSSATAQGLLAYRSLAGAVAQADFPSELYHEIASQNEAVS